MNFGFTRMATKLKKSYNQNLSIYFKVLYLIFRVVWIITKQQQSLQQKRGPRQIIKLNAHRRGCSGERSDLDPKLHQ